MGGRLRKSGSDFVGDIPWGTHFCCFYRTKQDLIDLLIPFIKAGLENNEACLWVVSDPLDVQDAGEAIKKAIPDLDDYLQKSQIKIVPHTDWYYRDGELYLRESLNRWVQEMEQAISRGFDGLRAMSSAVWPEQQDWETLMKYEQMVNEMIGQTRMIVFCSYYLPLCKASDVIDVVNSHQVAVFRKDGSLEMVEKAEYKKARQLFCDSEEKLRVLTETANCAIAIIHDGNICYANPAMERITGYNREELLKKDVCQLVHPDCKGLFSRKALKPNTEKATFSLQELKILSKDGDEKWVTCNCGSVMFQGQPAVMGTFFDITAHKRAEEIIWENEEYFYSLFGNATLGMALLSRGGHILKANDVYCSFLGYQPVELAGMHFSQLTYPEDLGEEMNLHNALIKGEIEGYVFEKRYIRSDGKIIRGRINASLLRDCHSSIRYKLIFCEDITALKNSEYELTAQNRIYRTMLGALEEVAQVPVNHGEGIRTLADMATSLQERHCEEIVAGRMLQVACEITGVSWGAYYGYDEDDGFINLLSTAGFSKETAARLKEETCCSLDDSWNLIRNVANSRKSCYIPDTLSDARWISTDLEVTIRSCYFVPLYYGKRLYGVYALLSPRVDGFYQERRDLADAMASCISIAMENTRLFDEMRQVYQRLSIAQQQLFQSQKLESVGKLASGMAHEINNQLTVIQACLDLYARNGSLHFIFSKIRQAVERSVNLIRQLMLFGRENPRSRSPVNLNQSLKELSSMVKQMIGEDIVIHFDLSDDLWMVNADTANIDQVLVNLILNARDAMPSGGTITVKTRNVQLDDKQCPQCKINYQDKYVQLSVSDTGVGMEDKVISHVFDPFFTTKEVGEGIGLGLSVVYGIVNTYDGWIELDSRVGQGSRFEVYLPAAEQNIQRFCSSIPKIPGQVQGLGGQGVSQG